MKKIFNFLFSESIVKSTVIQEATKFLMQFIIALMLFLFLIYSRYLMYLGTRVFDSQVDIYLCDTENCTRIRLKENK